MTSNVYSEYLEGFEKVKNISCGERSCPLACLQQKDGLERRLVVDNGRNNNGAIICSCRATAEQVQKCLLTARPIARANLDNGEFAIAKARCACADARENELAKLMKRPGGREG